jgi:hypothetical protein
MPTLQAYENGLTLGWPGGRSPCRFDRSCCIKPACECRDGRRRLCCRHAPAKRGQVNGWSAGAVREHTRWLRSVDTTRLDGQGVAVTLTVRDCPPTSDHWTRLRNALHERLRRAGLLRWHWVTEWQRRGVPHLHLAVYAPSEWRSCRRGPGADRTGPQRPLEHLRAARHAQERIHDAIGFLVLAARDEGRTWGQIGDALQISRQAARQAQLRRDRQEQQRQEDRQWHMLSKPRPRRLRWFRDRLKAGSAVHGRAFGRTGVDCFPCRRPCVSALVRPASAPRRTGTRAGL